MNSVSVEFDLAVGNLDMYTSCLIHKKMYTVSSAEFFFEDNTVGTIKQLVHNQRYPFRRLHDLRCAIESICLCVLRKKVNYCFPLYLTENAFMTDDGKLYISLYFILNSSGERVFKVLIHEIAHLWLSQQANYGSVLKTDLEFCVMYHQIGLNPLLSPVELSASILSCEMIEALANHADEGLKSKLLNISRDERARIYQELDTIPNILFYKRRDDNAKQGQ